MTEGDLGRLTRVDVADVVKRGELAGTIRRVGGGTEFRYDPAYLASGGPAVATTLPPSDVPVVCPGGAVPPFFAGLLPEGRRLSSLRRAIKTSADDELSLLLAVGEDTVGDVQIVPHGRRAGSVTPLVQVDRAWDEVRFADLLGGGGIVDPVGIPGVQDKVSARMLAVPVRRAGERYLLKLDPPEFPIVTSNEAFFLGLARRVRLDAARGELVTDADGRPGLLVRRFDRMPTNDGATIALACEDACQVRDRWPADKYLMDTEGALVALADRCAARPVALLALFRQVCFAWLTGNGDQHAKNLAILSTPTGEWRVAPAYDLPSTVPYGDTATALPIGGRTRGLARRHLLGLADAIGLPSRAATEALDDLLARLAGLPDEIAAGALPFDRKTNDDLAAELRHRARQARAGA